MVMGLFVAVFGIAGSVLVGTDFEITVPEVSPSSVTIPAKISQAPVAPDTHRILVPSLFPVQTPMR